jgi:hypothetical protein
MSKKTVPNGTKSSKGLAKESEPAPDDYKVGPGRPPREHRFKPGQSGNPKGRKPKAPSIEPELRTLLDAVLNRKVKIRQGDRERNITMLAAGFEQLGTRAAQGDRHAFRDVIDLMARLKPELFTGNQTGLSEGLGAMGRALLDNYVARHTGPKQVSAASPVLAPPELADDAEG